MPPLKEVNTLLYQATLDPNGWYDYFEEVAVQHAKKLTDEEWNEVSKTWEIQDENWQAILAGLLGSWELILEKTVPILEHMVMTGGAKVLAAAISSLEAMDASDKEAPLYVPGPAIRKQLEKIYAEEQHPGRKKNIEYLLKRKTKL